MARPFDGHSAPQALATALVVEDAAISAFMSASMAARPGDTQVLPMSSHAPTSSNALDQSITDDATARGVRPSPSNAGAPNVLAISPSFPLLSLTLGQSPHRPTSSIAFLAFFSDPPFLPPTGNLSPALPAALGVQTSASSLAEVRPTATTSRVTQAAYTSKLDALRDPSTHS